MDRSTFRFVNRIAVHTGWAHPVARLYADYGIALFGALLVLAWWEARHSVDPPAALAAAVWSGIAGVVAFGVAQVVGNLVDRARPYETMPHSLLLISRTHDFSFPSDHATVTAAVAAGLLAAAPLLGRWRLGVVAAVLAVGMAVVRVYVGAHYPGDVLAGLALGGATGILLARPARVLLTPVARAAARTPLEPLVRVPLERQAAEIEHAPGPIGR